MYFDWSFRDKKYTSENNRKFHKTFPAIDKELNEEQTLNSHRNGFNFIHYSTSYSFQNS